MPALPAPDLRPLFISAFVSGTVPVHKDLAAKAMWKAVIPLGRMGDPSEIRGLALLLASKAGSFMTGGV